MSSLPRQSNRHYPGTEGFSTSALSIVAVVDVASLLISYSDVFLVVRKSVVLEVSRDVSSRLMISPSSE